MDALQRAVPCPQLEIAVHRAFGREVLGQMTPRAASLQHVKQPTNHRTDIDLARTTAMLGRRDQWRKNGPFVIAQVARIAQCRSVVACPALLRPHLVPLSTVGTTYRITNDSSDSTPFRTGSNNVGQTTSRPIFAVNRKKPQNCPFVCQRIPIYLFCLDHIIFDENASGSQRSQSKPRLADEPDGNCGGSYSS